MLNEAEQPREGKKKKKSSMLTHSKCCHQVARQRVALTKIKLALEKTLMLGRTGGRRRRDEMAGWHHRLNGHEFE